MDTLFTRGMTVTKQKDLSIWTARMVFKLIEKVMVSNLRLNSLSGSFRMASDTSNKLMPKMKSLFLGRCCVSEDGGSKDSV